MNVDLIVGATEYSLSDGTLSRIEWMDGWGESPLHRLSERGPLQHGLFDKGFRLDPRVASLGLYVSGSSMSDLWDKRATLLRYFKPSDDVRKIRFTLDNGDVRTFEGHSAGGMTMPMRGGEGFAQTVAVQFVCADPTPYDPTAEVVIFSTDVGGTGMPVPLLVPVTVGESELDFTESVTYGGDWQVLPEIRIKGPINSPKVENLTTDEKLDFSGYSIASGDWYDIDCAFGAKTVTNSSVVNKISELSDDSDLATFHLDADPEAPGGINDIKVTGTGADSNTRVRLLYYDRYMGV